LTYVRHQWGLIWNMAHIRVKNVLTHPHWNLCRAEDQMKQNERNMAALPRHLRRQTVNREKGLQKLWVKTELCYEYSVRLET